MHRSVLVPLQQLHTMQGFAEGQRRKMPSSVYRSAYGSNCSTYRSSIKSRTGAASVPSRTSPSCQIAGVPLLSLAKRAKTKQAADVAFRYIARGT